MFGCNGPNYTQQQKLISRDVIPKHVTGKRRSNKSLVNEVVFLCNFQNGSKMYNNVIYDFQQEHGK